MTVVLLISSPIWGMPFTREPVAMTTAFFASYVSFPTFTVRFLPQHAGAPDDGDLVLLHQELDALGVLLRDLARAPHGDAVVGLHGADLDPELLGVVSDQVGDVGAVQQRLGGDAADVDAHPAELVPLDHGGGEPQLGRADGADVPGRPAAHDDHVERLCHDYPPESVKMSKGQRERSEGGCTCPLHSFRVHARHQTSASGFSSIPFSVWRNRAPVAPSITR